MLQEILDMFYFEVSQAFDSLAIFCQTKLVFKREIIRIQSFWK